MYCSKLQYWSQQGKFADLPLELSRHAQTCATCSRFLTEVELSRRWVEKASIHRVPVQRLNNIEVLLRAEARFAPLMASSSVRPSRWFLAAAAAVLLVSAGAAAAWIGNQRPPAVVALQKSDGSPQVIVALTPGARGHSDLNFPQSSYFLEAGEGEFDVGQFLDDRAFHVLSGSTTISARSAHFRVRVQAGRIEQLHVMAGEVTLDVPGESPVVVGPGRSIDWSAKPAGMGHPQEPALVDNTLVDSAPEALPPPSPSAIPMARSDGQVTRAVAMPGATREVPDDTAFANAFAQLDAGRAREAALTFDSLIRSGQLDPQRRADVLYWSSQAHARAGNRTLAESRAFAYVSSYPKGLHATDAALLLGDYARDKKQYALARRYYEKALSSGRSTTAARAKLALSQLPQ